MDIPLYQKERDRMVGILSKDGKFRVILVKNTLVSQIAQKNHHLPSIPAMYLAKAFTSACFLASLLKGEERVAIIIHGNHSPIESIIAEASQVGEVRGYVKHHWQENKNNPLDFKLEGLLRIEKVLYNRFRAPDLTTFF